MSEAIKELSLGAIMDTYIIQFTTRMEWTYSRDNFATVDILYSVPIY